MEAKYLLSSGASENEEFGSLMMFRTALASKSTTIGCRPAAIRL
jgi:hypothetical protein